MKSTIANPSIICAGFGRFDSVRFNKFKYDANKKGIVIREMKIFDIQIPVDKKYNDAVNFLKQNISPILRRYLLNLPFKKIILNHLEEKTNLKEFDYKEFDKHFIQGNLYRYGYLGLTPLFIDTKYNKLSYNPFDTKEEEENYKNLFSLKSKGYKPLMTPTKEEKDFKK